MLDSGPNSMRIFLVFIGLVYICNGQSPIDPDVKARLEAKVIQSMSLRELEDMVEKDERVLTAPRSKLIIIPKGARDDPNQEAYIIQRKQKDSPSIKPTSERGEFRFDNKEFDDEFESPFGKEFGSPLLRRSYLPKYSFESAFKFDEEFPSLFSSSDLRQEGSSPVNKFYESIVQKVIKQRADAEERLPILESSESERVINYRPRFAYDSYAKDPTEVKLKGKKYWRDAPTRREEGLDENGCRTIVKKVIDPEDGKKASGAKAKSVIITKECESPTINGPDAKILEMESPAGIGASGSQFEPLRSFDEDRPSYEKSRPEELDLPRAEAKDPIAPDYIDKMLETHFKSFPAYTNPITSFRGYQDRFNLQIPSAFKEIKPTVHVESYDRSSPQSGFNDDKYKPDFSSRDLPKSNKHSFRYEYPAEDSNKDRFEVERAQKNFEHDLANPAAQPREHHSKKEFPSDDKYSNKKEPKMMKKSYAYYRKDNPKEDPNDQQYAEEFAQGNYRSFSTDYDSERDGPKKP